MRTQYVSDISGEKFGFIRPFYILALLERARKTTRTGSVELYELLLRYCLCTGCSWRAQPSDFPKWRMVPRILRRLECAARRRQPAGAGQRNQIGAPPERSRGVTPHVRFYCGRAEREELGHGRTQGL